MLKLLFSFILVFVMTNAILVIIVYTQTKHGKDLAMQNELTKTAEMLDRRRATRRAFGAITCDARRGDRAAAVATFPGLDPIQRGILSDAFEIMDCAHGTIQQRHEGAADLLRFLIAQNIN